MTVDKTNKPLQGIFTCHPHKGGRHHQTGKPVELMRDVLSIVKQAGHVLDPFMGSGSTGVAAIELGLKFTGIEYTQHYYNVANERMLEAKAAAC